MYSMLIICPVRWVVVTIDFNSHTGLEYVRIDPAANKRGRTERNWIKILPAPCHEVLSAAGPTLRWMGLTRSQIGVVQ